MPRPLRHFFCALAYFTRIPIPRSVGYRDGDLDHAAAWFPLVGLLVGLVAAASWWLADQFLPARVAIVVSMLASICLSGAFHEDGLADAVDGFGGGYERDSVLRIMHDSRIGSFGAIALILVLLLKLELLAAAQTWMLPCLLVAAHGASRWLALCLMLDLDYVRPEGKAKPVAQRLSARAFALATLCGLPPLFCLDWRAAITTIVLLLFARLLLVTYLRRRIGGYTGDTLGMAQQLSEIGIYMVFVAWPFI